MRDLLILAIVFGSIPLILARPWVGILMWYWIGLMVPHRLAWGIAVHFPVAQVVGLAALVGLLLAKDRKSIPLTRETVLMGLFAIHISVSTYFAWAPTAFGQWEQTMKILLMTFLTPVLIFGRHRIMWLFLVITVSIGFYGLKGGAFSVLTGGSYRVWGPSGSFIGANTALGMALIMVLPLMLIAARMFRERRAGIPMLERWSFPLGYFFYAMFGLSVLATIFTYSRGAWLGLLAVAPLIYLKMRHKLILALTGLVMAGSVVALMPEQVFNRFDTIQTFEEDWSAMQRLQAWGVAWNMASERPLIGVGFRNHDIHPELWLSYANWVEPWANSPRTAHSIFFQVIGQQGFLGAAIYFSMILFTILTLLRVYRRAARIESTAWMRDIAWALLVGMFGFLVAGAFLDMAYFTMVYVFIAMAVIMRRELDQATAREPVAAASSRNSRTMEVRRPELPTAPVHGRSPRHPSGSTRHA